MGQSHEGVVFIAGADDGLDGSDDAVFFVNFAVLLTAQADRVNVILLGEAVRLARTRHDDSDAAIEAIFFIGYIDSVVDEGTQEVAFTELQDTDGMFCFCIKFTYVFHRLPSVYI